MRWPGRAPISRPKLETALAWAEGRAIPELDLKRGVSYVVRMVGNADAMDRVVFTTSVDGVSRLARLAGG